RSRSRTTACRTAGCGPAWSAPPSRSRTGSASSSASASTWCSSSAARSAKRWTGSRRRCSRWSERRRRSPRLGRIAGPTQGAAEDDMQRWLSPFVAVLMLVSAQPVLAAQPEQGVVKDFVNPTPPPCNNPAGIAASPDGLIYAAGLSGNICVYTLSGELTRVIPVVAGHALLGVLFAAGVGLRVADDNPRFGSCGLRR